MNACQAKALAGRGDPSQLQALLAAVTAANAPWDYRSGAERVALLCRLEHDCFWMWTTRHRRLLGKRDPREPHKNARVRKAVRDLREVRQLYGVTL